MRSRSIFMLTTMLLEVTLLSLFLGNPSDASTYSAVVPDKVGYVITPGVKDQKYVLTLPKAVSALVPETIFGTEMDHLTPASGIDQTAAANSTWVRRNALTWSVVEPTEGGRDWGAVAGLESELQ